MSRAKLILPKTGKRKLVMTNGMKIALAGAIVASSFPAPSIIHSAAYANTLTGLIPDLYAAMNVISRELVGFIPSISRSASAERAAVGQTVVYDIAPELAAYDVTPAMNVPEPPDITLGSGTMAITKARAVPFGITGEEQRALNSSVGWLSVQGNLFAQALRTLVNEIETDIAALAIKASRAYGTPGTAPFASGVGDSAQLRKILDDNGAPSSGRSLIINTSAGANLRTNTQLTKANEAGSQMTLRDGTLLDIHNFLIKESAKVLNFTKGTGASATTNAAGYAIGAKVITLASAGTGEIKAGDHITFAGDANKYVVASGDADVSGGGTITLASPGLRVAIPASATAITVGNSAAYNLGFSADAIVGAFRPPALPNQGDLAIDRMLITDPRSGMVFEISIYPGYRKVRAEVALAWGVEMVNPAHSAILLG